MNNPKPLPRLARLSLSLLAITALAASSHGQIYMDNNGATAGFGNLSGLTWDTTSSLWTTDSAGETAPGLWNNTSGPTTFKSTANASITLTASLGTVSGLQMIANESGAGISITLTGSGSSNRNLTLANNGTIYVDANGRPEAGLAFNANATLLIGSSGTLNITASNAASFVSLASVTNAGATVGTFNIGSGQLRIGSGRTTASTHIAIASGASMRADAALTVGNLSGAGNVVTDNAAAARSLTVTQTTNATFSGVIGENTDATNTMSFTKAGAATLTLSGANTYDGATTVSAGTLLVDGSTSASSAVSVTGGSANSAVLGGTGTIGGSVTFTTAAGGVLSAGGTNAIGTLTTGAVSASTASIIKMELGATASSHDILKALSLTATNFTLDLTNFGGLTFTEGQSFNLFQTQAGEALSVGGTFTIVNLPTLAGLLTWDQSALYTEGTLSIVSAIPEPSSVGLLLGGLALSGTLVSRRRRR